MSNASPFLSPLFNSHSGMRVCELFLTRVTCTHPGLVQVCASFAIRNTQTVHKCASLWGPRSQPPLLQPLNAIMERLGYLWSGCCAASLCLSCPLLRENIRSPWRRLFAKAVNELDAASSQRVRRCEQIRRIVIEVGAGRRRRRSKGRRG
jgi:hypothetical protein